MLPKALPISLSVGLTLHFLQLCFQDWEQIKYRQSERDLVQLNCDILEAWKQNCNKYNVRPTLRDIGRAFGNIGKHIKIIESTLFD